MADCIIVGAGINGVLTALELQQAGADVLLLDRQQVGAESSWAGGGIISPLYPWRYPDAVTRLAQYSQQHYPALIDCLHLETGIDPQYTQNGLLVLNQNETAQAQLWRDRWQAKLEMLPAASITDCEPEITQAKQQAVWMPEVAQVRNPRLVKAMRAVLKSRRIDFREQAAVTSLRVQNNQIKGVMVGEDFLPADKVVIASGAWSGRILKQLQVETTIKPVKGQMIILKGLPEQVKRIVLADDHYLIPRRDGRILVGSTIEHTEFKKTTTQQARDALFQFASELIPSLASLQIEYHWAGLRPGTDNGVPYIGQHPKVAGLFFNAGQFRNGIVLAPASARLLADIILQKESFVAADDYAVTAKH